jgi:hypothetical protein
MANAKVNASASASVKIKIGFLTPISGEWFNMYSDKIEMAKNVEEAKYIIYESNGDPVIIINNIKNNYPKHKLVFILSGDQNSHIDNECIWFTNAVKPSGLMAKQTQIFVTNPAIFKFYENHKQQLDKDVYSNGIVKRNIDIYFKGTIWTGMRTNMYNYFKDKSGCKIIENNKYWDWRLHPFNKPTQQQLENTAYESYDDILDSKLCLCPKGNGNSSMRIIEALACGSIPILINDFTSPFGIYWKEFGLVFDTNKQTWENIYIECKNLLADESRMLEIQKKAYEYFKNVIYGDTRQPGFRMYNDLNTVCFGFSKLIVDKLLNL